jgi:tetratricopeptide (TPR) repeat protein
MSVTFEQNVSDLVGQSAAHRREGRFADAERLLAAAERLAPGAWQPSYHLAILELHRGDAQAALERLHRLEGGAAPQGELHHLIGRAYRRLGDDDRAALHLEKSLAAQPEHAAARVMLGILRRRPGRLEEARECFARAAIDRPDLAEAHLNLGALLKDLGRFREAEASLARGVELWPQSAEGWYWLGEVREELGANADAAFRNAGRLKPGLAGAAHEEARREAAAGNAARATALLRRVVTLDPRLAGAWAELGDRLQAAGERKGAVAAYRSSIDADPAQPAVLNNLGVLCIDAGSPTEGIGYLRRAQALEPDSVETLNNLGLALLDNGDPASAKPFLDAAVRVDPARAVSHANFARACLATGAAGEALEAASEALRLDPGSADARIAHAGALRHLERWDEAERELRELAEAAPSRVDAHLGLGELLIEQGRFADGEQALRRAATIAPDSAEALSNLGVALYQGGRPREALELFDRALELKPDHYATRLWRSMAYLMLGELASGWREFEWRWRGFEELGKAQLRFPAPRFQGEALRGKTIVLHGEQGMGDVLQFARFAASLAKRGARVWLYVHAPLVRLLKSVPGVDRVFAFGEVPPAMDFHCQLMSLPGVLGIGLDDLPCVQSYLSAPAAQTARWRRRLEGAPGLRVGLAWSGDPRKHDRLANLTDARRSLRLAQLAPLARVAGVTWVSLQKGEAASQAVSPPHGMRLLDFTAELDDFADTAALACALDLVITVDTSIVHLAGGLGRPVWMLSRFDGCWRWMLERTDSPWYPTLRIFRQSAPLDWSEAIAALGRALEARSARIAA